MKTWNIEKYLTNVWRCFLGCRQPCVDWFLVYLTNFSFFSYSFIFIVYFLYDFYIIIITTSLSSGLLRFWQISYHHSMYGTFYPGFSIPPLSFEWRFSPHAFRVSALSGIPDIIPLVTRKHLLAFNRHLKTHLFHAAFNTTRSKSLKCNLIPFCLRR